MSGNVLRLICPNLTCRTILSVPAAARGKDVRCRACGSKLRIPMPKAASISTPASDADSEKTDASPKKG